MLSRIAVIKIVGAAASARRHAARRNRRPCPPHLQGMTIDDGGSGGQGRRLHFAKIQVHRALITDQNNTGFQYKIQKYMARAARRFENADVLCVVYGTHLIFSKSLQKGVLMMWMTPPKQTEPKKSFVPRKFLKQMQVQAARMRAQRMRQSALAPTFQLAWQPRKHRPHFLQMPILCLEISSRGICSASFALIHHGHSMHPREHSADDDGSADLVWS